MLSSKNLDYQDFRRVAFMMKDGVHLTEKGMFEIKGIKENMNSKRSFEERWNYLDKAQPVLNNEWVQAFIDSSSLAHSLTLPSLRKWSAPSIIGPIRILGLHARPVLVLPECKIQVKYV